jgi:cytochrome P450
MQNVEDSFQKEGQSVQEVYDPFDPDQVDDDYDILKRFRETAPVDEIAPGVFLVTKMADARAIMLDAGTFPQGGFTSGGISEDMDFDLVPLGYNDPPAHTKIRRNIASVMTSGRLREYEPTIRDIAANLATSLAGMTSADFVEAFAGPYPAEVILTLSGIPLEQMDSVRRYTADFIESLTEVETPFAGQAAERLRQYDGDFLAALRQVMSGPAEDVPPLLRGLMGGVDRDGAPISERRMLTHFTKDILVAGLESTIYLLGNMFFQILSEDGLYEHLQAHPEERSRVIEESLRHLTPVSIVMRRAARDVEIAGVKVPEGSMLVVSLNSANHDESTYQCPERFNPSRDRGERHVAFGHGAHNCVGAPLARLEAACALDAILTHVPKMRLRPGEVYERVEGFSTVRGPRHLMIEIG